MKASPSKTNATAQPGLKKFAVLAAAALGSFVLAAAMQATWQDGDADLDLASAPRQRVARAQIDAAPSLTDAAVIPRAEVAMNGPGQRMNKMVVRDPFGPLAPEAAPPPEMVATPMPQARVRTRKPQAAGAEPPPLPFTAVGSIQGKRIGNGQQQAFIQHGDALTVIQKGDTVAGNYRVDDITPDSVVFTYLPLGQKQSLLLLDNTR